MNYNFNKKYTRGQIANYFAESARIYGEKVQNGHIQKNIVFDAAIVEFINTISGSDYALYSSDMYIDNYRKKDAFYIPLKSDVKNIALNSKQIYLWEIKLSNNNSNTPMKATMLNKHMHEDISGIKFTDADILQYIDNFLIQTCELNNVKIDKQELKAVEEFFKSKQTAEKIEKNEHEM